NKNYLYCFQSFTQFESPWSRRCRRCLGLLDLRRRYDTREAGGLDGSVELRDVSVEQSLELGEDSGEPLLQVVVVPQRRGGRGGMGARDASRQERQLVVELRLVVQVVLVRLDLRIDELLLEDREFFRERFRALLQRVSSPQPLGALPQVLHLRPHVP